MTKVTQKVVEVFDDWRNDISPQDIYVLLCRLASVEDDPVFAKYMNEIRHAYKMSKDEL